MDTFDVIVIGAGAVGENAAAAAAAHGLSVVIVERELVGGECSYWACMPSKALLRPGKVVDAAARVPGVGVDEALDAGAALDWRDQIASHWDDSSQVDWLDGVGVTLIRGTARLDGPRRVEVQLETGSSQCLNATRAVVIATGSRPRRPSIEGIDDVGIWTSRDATTASKVPGRILIIGGGTVGVEMAQAWAWLGAEVTLIHNGDRLLNSEEPFVGHEIRTALEESGVEVVTEGQTRRLHRSEPEGTVTASVDTPAGTLALEADEVLVATGRTGRVEGLGLESVGVEAPNGYISVNGHLQVEGPAGEWLYAVGDVNGRALLTHSGKYQARIAGDHIAGVASAAVAPVHATPRVIFTSPEVAAVGLTETGARELGITVDTISHDIAKTAGATTLGKGYTGTAKLVIDTERQILVGATFVGPGTGELLHSATIAIVAEVPLSRLWHAVPSFPTLSEVWLRLLENYREAGWDPYGS
ncbi:MAG TPA: NAD(P)/FAD-dependent oxidoreductase [Acidimicrobiia bacterium]|nr:NAD(P)/FAD-dependent oxidoreductase [Acidimicrobiia bacterium]